MHPHILVIRFSSLGDLVLILPLLKALKSGFPASRIELACKKEFAGLFEGCTAIDRLHELEDGGLIELLRLRSRLKRERFDIIIDAHNVIRSNIIYHTLSAGTKVQIRKDHAKKLLLIKGKLNLYAGTVPLSRRYTEIAGRLGTSAAAREAMLEIPARAAERAAEILSAAGLRHGKLVAAAPGARWETKRWPGDYYAHLISDLAGLGLSTILVGGKGDADAVEEISRSSAAALNLTGKLSIMETAAVLRESLVLVTNDSAPLHISEAVGTPVVALFGPTVKEFGYFPRLPESIPLETDIGCRPCSRNGARPCPAGTRECLTSIGPDRVREAVLDLAGREETGAKKAKERNGGLI